MTAQPRYPNPGELFDGKYRVERTIGRGGFSRVFEATQMHHYAVSDALIEIVQHHSDNHQIGRPHVQRADKPAKANLMRDGFDACKGLFWRRHIVEGERNTRDNLYHQQVERCST